MAITGKKRCSNPRCNNPDFDHDLDAIYCIHCGRRFPDRKCPRCGFENHPTVLEDCTHCGNPLALRICRKCNRENEPDALHCMYCGAAFPRTREKIFWVVHRVVPLFLGIFIGIMIWPVPGKKHSSSSHGPVLLNVQVVDSLGYPLAGVALAVIGGPKMDHSDSNGKLEVELTDEVMPKDTLFFELTKDLYLPEYDHLAVKPDSVRYERKYVLRRIEYVVKFLFRDEAGKPIAGVEVYRDHGNSYSVGKSDSNGKFEYGLFSLDAPIEFAFAKSCYQSMQWTVSKDSFAYSNQIEKEIQLRRLFFNVQCVDTSSLYADSLENIRVAVSPGNIVRYTDSNGKCYGLPLTYSNAPVRLEVSREPIFLTQVHETSVRRGEIVRIILSPREGTLTLNVRCPDDSPAKYATVTIEGAGYQHQNATDSDGTVSFESSRIRPGEKVRITVRKGTQEEKYRDVLFTKWNMERTLTFPPCGG